MSKALTLSGLMALLLPKERLFVIHHLGADISEAVAGGTVEELERTRCVEVCGNNKGLASDPPLCPITSARSAGS